MYSHTYIVNVVASMARKKVSFYLFGSSAKSQIPSFLLHLGTSFHQVGQELSALFKNTIKRKKLKCLWWGDLQILIEPCIISTPQTSAVDVC